jgi:MFS transporter, ACS family, solute carrier family 17 (sodium-dependent inorganic phosphate cotransporter), other
LSLVKFWRFPVRAPSLIGFISPRQGRSLPTMDSGRSVKLPAPVAIGSTGVESGQSDSRNFACEGPVSNSSPRQSYPRTSVGGRLPDHLNVVNTVVGSDDQPRGWKVFVLHAFASFVICNIDRINLSVAIIPMAAEFGWSQTTKGIVQAIFFCGYISTGIVGGRVADRVGGRLVLGWGVAAWSIMTVLTPPAAHFSYPVLLIVRLILGLFEGVAMPAMNALVKMWVPSIYISRSLGFIYSGMHAGSVVGLLATPPIISAISWEYVFYISGAFGMLWAGVFLLTTHDSPPICSDTPTRPSAGAQQSTHWSRQSYMSLPGNSGHGGERQGPAQRTAFSIDSDVRDAERVDRSNAEVKLAHSLEPPTLRHLLAFKAVWAIIIAHFCTTWGYFVLLMWLPSYYSARFGLSVAQSAQFSVFPWVLMFFATQSAGHIADFLISVDYPLTHVRKFMQAIAFIGPALFLSLLTTATSKYFAIGCITAGLGFASFAHGGVYCAHQDIAGSCTGTLLGISNTFASIPGIIGVGVTGYILDKSGGEWNYVFALAVLIYLLGAVVFSVWGSSERIFL